MKRSQIRLSWYGNPGQGAANSAWDILKGKTRWQIHGICDITLQSTSVADIGHPSWHWAQHNDLLHPSQHNVPDSYYQSVNTDMMNAICQLKKCSAMGYR